MILTSCRQPTQIKAALNPVTHDTVLDPSQLWLADYYVIADNLLLKLVHINANNDYELLLADRIEPDSTGTVYDITIKKAFFSDGTLITSGDIVASLKRLALYGSAHIPFKDFLLGYEGLKSIDANIQGFEIVSSNRLRIRLKHRVKEFIYYLSLADAGILHPSLVRKEKIIASDWKIVSGAYTLAGDKLIANNSSLAFHEQMPDEVILSAAPKMGSKKDLFQFDIGYSGFLDKSEVENATLPPPFVYTSSSYQYLVYLVLNPMSSKFRDISTRQLVAKTLHEKLDVNAGPFFKKANQFFLPDSFAFQKSLKPERLFNDAVLGKEIPDFEISATIGTRKYTPTSLDTRISSALGNRVSIAFTDPIERFKQRKEVRDFDAYMVPTSMSYNVVTESLNLLYRAKPSFGTNPNKKIIELIAKYQKTQGSSPELIEEIVKEMTLEAEIIPMFYVSSPKFYNSDRLDISEMNTAESLTFWKLRVK